MRFLVMLLLGRTRAETEGEEEDGHFNTQPTLS